MVVMYSDLYKVLLFKLGNTSSGLKCSIGSDGQDDENEPISIITYRMRHSFGPNSCIELSDDAKHEKHDRCHHRILGHIICPLDKRIALKSLHIFRDAE